VTKQELQYLLREYGDAVITYRSENSGKLKYNVCTSDFDNTYIKGKSNRAEEGEDSILLFCWDCDSFRLIKPSRIKSVVPLASILRNE